MKKIKEFLLNHVWSIMLVSLILMVISCCIIGTLDLDTAWYILSGIFGLGIILPFAAILVYSFIVVPFLKLKDKIKKK